MRRLGLASLASVAAACLCATAAQGFAVITPNTTSDDITNNGNCTLREAVQAANTDTAVDQCPAGNFIDEIDLGAGTYDLTIPGARENSNATGDLDITSAIKILGQGSNATTIDAHSNDRAIDITSTGSLNIGLLTITNGAAPGPPSLLFGGAGESGGAIRSLTGLILGDMAVTNSHAGDARTGNALGGADGSAGGDGGGVWCDNQVKMTRVSFVSDHAGSGSDGGAGTSASAGTGDTGQGGGDGGAGGNGGAVAITNGAGLGLFDTTFNDDHAGAGGAGGDGGKGGTAGGNGGAGGNGAPGGEGGAIYLTAASTLTGTSISGSTAGTGGGGGAGGQGFGGPISFGVSGQGAAGGSGGAVGSASGSLTVRGSTFTGDSAGVGGPGPAQVVMGLGGLAGDGGNGGAIAAGTVNIDHTAISNAHAGNGGEGSATGGGINVVPGGRGGGGGGVDASSATLADTTISSTSAGAGGNGGKDDGGTGVAGSGGPGGAGGGLRSPGASLTDVTLDHDTAGAGGHGGTAGFSGSHANGGAGGVGGGLLADSGALANVTLDADAAGAGGAGAEIGNGANGGDGGGIRATSATLTLSHVTIAGSSPGSAGLAAPGSTPGTAGAGGGISGPAGVGDSVIAGNSGAQCAGTNNGSGNVNFPDSSCGGVNGDPKLEALADNGGTTRTLLLGAGSAALDTIPAGGADCTGTDQRGVSRPQGPACDSGAVEAANPALTADGVDFGVVSQGQTPAKTVTVHDTLDPLHPQLSLTSTDFSIVADGCSGAVLAPAGTCTVQVSVNAGASPGARSATLHLTHDAAGPALDVPLTATVVDTTPPVVTGLTLSHKTFRVAKRKPAPKGTTIRFTLSEAASVKFTVTQKRPGRRKGKRCVAPTRKLRHAKHCTRTVTVGNFIRTAGAGASSIPFSGRLNGRKLKPGGYTLTLSPTDPSGNHGQRASIGFKIVKR